MTNKEFYQVFFQFEWYQKQLTLFLTTNFMPKSEDIQKIFKDYLNLENFEIDYQGITYKKGKFRTITILEFNKTITEIEEIMLKNSVNLRITKEDDKHQEIKEQLKTKEIEVNKSTGVEDNEANYVTLRIYKGKKKVVTFTDLGRVLDKKG